MCSSDWKNMSADTRKIYEAQAEKDKVRYQQQIASLSPGLQSRLSRLKANAKRLRSMRRGPFQRFFKSFCARSEHLESQKDKMTLKRLAKTEWNAMSKSAKKEFKEPI